MKRDIVVFVVDCLREDTLRGLWRRGKLHGIGGLFKTMSEVRNVFSTGGKTTPAFASILTGCYPYRHRIRTLYGYQLSPSSVTLPEILRDHGYRTEAYVTGPLFQETGLTKGFDVYEYRAREEYVHTDWGKRLVEILGARSAKPRFIFVHFWELHRPRQVIDEYASPCCPFGLYERALLSLDSFFRDHLSSLGLEEKIMVLTGDHGERISQLEWIWEKFKGKDLDRSSAGAQGNNRTKGISKRIKNRVKQMMHIEIGHGFSFNEELIRVPLLLQGTQGDVALPRKELCSQLDIFPTLLDLVDIPVPKNIDGISLLASASHESLYLENCISEQPDDRMVIKGVRTIEHKYVVRPFAEQAQEEVYDLRNDPHEKHNLRSELRAQQVLDHLKEELTRFGVETLEDYMEGFSEPESEYVKERMIETLRELGYM